MLKDLIAEIAPGGPNAALSANCAIKFIDATAYKTDGQRLMGRQAAGEGFIRAWCRYSGVDELYCLARTKEEAKEFARLVESILPNKAENKSIHWVQQLRPHQLASLGTLYLPSPQLASYGWKRRRDGLLREDAYSLVGVTHTTCEQGRHDALADMLIAPVHPWDAQICPSEAVRVMIARLLDAESDFLRERLGAARLPRPQLPVIPLGVDCAQFSPDAELRRDWRARLNLRDEDVAVLYMGRLDLFTKANLFPMFDALERASRLTAKRLVLVLAGWFANEFNEQLIRTWAPRLCPSVGLQIVDGRPLDARRGVWRAADIFTSLVDNVQETFGLTPIEAMAAGLPSVVSDFDGYKESVRDGIDGWRIRTVQAPAGSCEDLMVRHADAFIGYNHYVGRASWFIGVDVEQAARAYANLADDPGRRREMGEAARRRALESYEWARIIPQYQALYAELADMRRVLAGKRAPPAPAEGAPRYPRRPDPMWMFSHYGSQPVTGKLRVSLAPGAGANALEQWLAVPIYAFGNWPLLRREELLPLLAALPADGSEVLVQELLRRTDIPAAAMGHTCRLLAWLFKVGLVRLGRAGES